jgi:hypothetical protein
VRVDWAIPCRYAEVQPGRGATIIGAGTDVIIAPHVPVPMQVLFAVRFVGDPDELDGEMAHPVVCRIFAPGGDPIGEQTAGLTVDATQLVPGYLADVTIPMGIVIETREYGTYHVEFEIDGHSQRVPIHVIDPSSQPGLTPQ